MIEAAAGIMLTICAAEDLLTGRISVWCPAVCMAVGIGLRLLGNTLMTMDFGTGLLVGLIFLAISVVSGKQVGDGDGIVLMACGICVGGGKVISVLFGGMILFLVTGAGGMIIRHWNGKKELPFIPFLWVAYMCGCLVSWVNEIRYT